MTMSDQSIGDAMTIRAGGRAILARIDQYELVCELGGGGFGMVFLAYDTVAGIHVAVKGLPPLVRNNREELENIRKNFALVSRLHHPHIAAALVLHPVQNVSYAEQSVADKLRVFKDDFLVVMEYAPGVTLSSWRKRFLNGKVPVEQAFDIVRQLADALDYAHAEKIIHRDIKPANIMVETRAKVERAEEGQGAGGDLVVRVLDFGLAAEVRSSMGRVSRQVTDTSGTRPYMAPEQWLGKKQNAATDQYALAALTYELLTGEVPFASVFETGDPFVMLNVVGREEPELPKDMPPALRKAFVTALAKDPARRFATCRDFAEALRGGRARRSFASPGRIAAVTSALAVFGVVGFIWQHHEAGLRRRALDAARHEAEVRQIEEKRLKAAAAAKAAAEDERRRLAAAKIAEAERRKAESDARAAAEATARKEAEAAARKAEAEARAAAETGSAAALRRQIEEEAAAEAKRVAEEKIIRERRQQERASLSVPRKMLAALSEVGADFSKCMEEPFVSLGCPFAEDIQTTYRELADLVKRKKKLQMTFTDKHPDVIRLDSDIVNRRRKMTEIVSLSAEIVETCEQSYDQDVSAQIKVLETSPLAFEFFSSKLPVSLRLKLRQPYAEHVSALKLLKELRRTLTEKHPDVKAAREAERKSLEAFVSEITAYQLSCGKKAAPAQIVSLPPAARRLVGAWACDCTVTYKDSMGSRADDAIKRGLPVSSRISLRCDEDGTVALSDSSGRSFGSCAGTWKYRHGMLIMDLTSNDGRSFRLGGVVNWRGDSFELHYDNVEYANMIRQVCARAIPNLNAVNSTYVDGRLEVSITTQDPAFKMGTASCSPHLFTRQ